MEAAEGGCQGAGGSQVQDERRKGGRTEGGGRRLRLLWGATGGSCRLADILT